MHGDTLLSMAFMVYFPGISWMSPKWRIVGMTSSSLGVPLTTYTFSLTKFWSHFKGIISTLTGGLRLVK